MGCGEVCSGGQCQENGLLIPLEPGRVEKGNLSISGGLKMVYLLISFYMLIQLLHEESKLVTIQVRLVSDKKLKRTERRQYREVQAKLVKQWEKNF